MKRLRWQHIAVAQLERGEWELVSHKDWLVGGHDDRGHQGVIGRARPRAALKRKDQSVQRRDRYCGVSRLARIVGYRIGAGNHAARYVRAVRSQEVRGHVRGRRASIKDVDLGILTIVTNVPIRRRAHPDKRRPARRLAGRSLDSLWPLWTLRSLRPLTSLRTLRSRRSRGTNQSQRQRERMLGIVTVAAPLYFEQKRAGRNRGRQTRRQLAGVRRIVDAGIQH